MLLYELGEKTQTNSLSHILEEHQYMFSFSLRDSENIICSKLGSQKSFSRQTHLTQCF